ncbi:MAG: basal-body rod modification protein FlgD [Candidatus Poribacteria bacterium]|nr:MAG: basal-body rod modification protein FlgD [Candidatus Poribacteria bacterium]
MLLNSVVGGSAGSGTLATPSAAPRGLDRDAFMRLLITQLRHQNPLEPVDNKDFIAQLSQFSSLEQLTQLRESVDEQIQIQRTTQQTLAVSLLGRQVEFESNQVSLRPGEQATLRYELMGPAERVQIEIHDVTGAVVRTLTPGAQPMGDQAVIWDGLDDQGHALPEGNYTYHVLAVGGGDRPVPVRPFLKGRVDGVRLTGGGLELLVGEQRVPLSQVTVVGLPTEDLTATDDGP